MTEREVTPDGIVHFDATAWRRSRLRAEAQSKLARPSQDSQDTRPSTTSAAAAAPSAAVASSNPSLTIDFQRRVRRVVGEDSGVTGVAPAANNQVSVPTSPLVSTVAAAPPPAPVVTPWPTVEVRSAAPAIAPAPVSAPAVSPEKISLAKSSPEKVSPAKLSPAVDRQAIEKFL
ncbi:MAG: hypothetical protein ACKPEY_00315, partial [Planctomycetota bacterium]